MAQRKGLCDFTTGKITQDTKETYEAGELVKLMKAASAKIKLKYTSEFVYFDDIVDDIDQDFEGGEIELEGDYLTAKVIELIRGHKNVKGMTLTGENDKADDVPILFRSKMTNGKYKFYCFYRVNFGSEEDEDFESMNKKSKRQNTKIKGTIMARRKDGLVKVEASEDELAASGADAENILKTWFTKVPEPIKDSSSESAHE
ncbi:hypothetical protein UT300003_07750 [Clostridium sardiniense]